MYEDDRRGRFVKGFFQNAANIHGGLGRRPFGDVFLAKAVVLSVQENCDDDLLTLGSEAWAEVLGDSLGGFECGGYEFPGAQAFPELKCSLNLRDFRRPKARHVEQVMNAGAVEAAKPSEILQKKEGRIVGGPPWNALPERP